MEAEQINPFPHSPPEVFDILQFWFSGPLEEQFQRWFAKGEAQKKLDTLITDKYGTLLKAAEEGKLEQEAAWCNSPASYAAKIILVDQFSRHIYRGQPEKIKENDKMSLAWSKDLIAKGWHQFLPVNQHVFSLMPLRHSNEAANLHIVMQHIEEREAKEEANTQFKKTTQHKMYDAEARNDQVDENTEILERHPFDADETFMYREKLYRCIHKFLKDKWYPEMRYVVVSLSGGVDSMVISKILVKLAPVMGFQVIAIHIDYGNRPESHLEADYVEQWCEKLGIIFRKRFVHELQRATSDRELYEKETRRIRFETYQNVLAEFSTESGVIFGHHKGDEQENMITNIMKGRENILNLSGMFPEGEILGVKIWRPLLPYTKDYIYEFAHKYGVPYFLDTTPKWSNRGKLRNELQPMLDDMFGSGYLENLSVLGEDSFELSLLAEKYIFAPFWQKLQFSEAGVWVEVSEKRDESKLFWKHTLRHMFHSIGTSTLRDKCMDHFLKQIRVPSSKFGLGVWVSLKKENASIIYENNLIIFRENFFPEKNYWPEKNFALGMSGEWTFFLPGSTTCGWKVKLEQVPSEQFKAIDVSLFELIQGPVTYYLRGSEGYCIDANARIKPFRQIPKLVNQVVPVVVISKDSDKKDHEIETCAKVTLEWINDEYAQEQARKKAKEEAAALRAAKQKASRDARQQTKMDKSNDVNGKDKEGKKHQHSTTKVAKAVEREEEEEDEEMLSIF